MTAPPSGRGLRALGWLLTPAVVWAAAFSGGWLGALLASRIAGPETGIFWMVGGSVVGGTAALIGWVLRLRTGARRAARLSVPPDERPETED